MLAALALFAGTWLVPWDYDLKRPEDLACFEELNPFVFAFDQAGRPKLLDAALLSKSLAARPPGTKIVPVIVNDIVDSRGRMREAKSVELLTRLLNTDKLVDAHVAALMRDVWRDEFDGLEIDYERIPPQLYPRFDYFLQRLGAELKKRGKYLAVDVEPAPIVKRSGPGAQWWPRFARHADVLKLMVYYETGSFSEAPGPGASIPWARSVAAKALESVPKDRLMLVFSLAGTDWRLPYSRRDESRQVKRLHYRQVRDLLPAAADAPVYDESLGAPHFLYEDPSGAGHEVWYEDERSLSEKLRLAADLGVRAGVWYLGKASPDLRSAGLCRP